MKIDKLQLQKQPITPIKRRASSQAEKSVVKNTGDRVVASRHNALKSALAKQTANRQLAQARAKVVSLKSAIARQQKLRSDDHKEHSATRTNITHGPGSLQRALMAAERNPARESSFSTANHFDQ